MPVRSLLYLIVLTRSHDGVMAIRERQGQIPISSQITHSQHTSLSRQLWYRHRRSDEVDDEVVDCRLMSVLQEIDLRVIMTDHVAQRRHPLYEVAVLS